LRNAVNAASDAVASILTSAALGAGHLAFTEINEAYFAVIAKMREQDELRQGAAYNGESERLAIEVETAVVPEGGTEDDRASVARFYRNQHARMLELKRRSETELLHDDSALRYRRRALEAARGPLVRFLDRYTMPNESEQMLFDADEHQGLGIFESSRSRSDEPIWEHVRWRR
jgi:hypothetical protein